MKPMKLETFTITDEPLDTFGPEAFENLQSPVNKEIAGMLVLGKRLTDAQLAAESYRQMIRAVRQSGLTDLPDGMHAPTDACIIGAINVETARLQTLVRFAMLPHYDEVPE